MAIIRITANPAELSAHGSVIIEVTKVITRERHEVKTVEEARAHVQALHAKLRASMGKGYVIGAYIESGRKPNGWDRSRAQLEIQNV